MSPVKASLAAAAPNSQAAMRVGVLLPAAVEQAFTYLAEHELPAGTLVEAKLMGRKLIGAVWNEDENDDVPRAKLKPIERAIETVPPLSAAFRKFIDWVAEFTLAPKGAVLALAALSLAGKKTRAPYVAPEYRVTLPTLTGPQQKAADALVAMLREKHEQNPILLDGVTGSGKTEVYFHAIAEALGAGRQVLVLLPEIALTHQWYERFAKTFGARPDIWHSQELPAARTKVWQAVANGEAKVVVGARSALFLPFKDLALIIVDEEQDPSYKQEEGVLYHARDMAIVRGKFEHAPVVLVSATPSLETLHNITTGRYRALHLPERYGAAGLPTVHLVDMVQDPPERGEFLSPKVRDEMLATLNKGEQTLLFLNRRGYAPLLLCRACGHRFQCDHCSAWLVVHGKKELLCHHCGHHEPIPKACPKCEAPAEKLAACGPGVERIAEEVRAMFGSEVPALRSAEAARAGAEGERGGSGSDGQSAPSAAGSRLPRIAILSSDETVAAETWAAIERNEVDILVGTQMAAKGHHFPHLTFVAVVDADIGLTGSDLRTAERTYQLLHQLAGRAGRADAPGQVYIQTYQPTHPVMQALRSHDRDRIMSLEAMARQAGGWPPYGQLAAILLDGTDELKVKQAGLALARSAPEDARITILGPAPAPLSRLRDQYRYRLLVKAQKGVHLQRTLKAWLDGKKFSGVRVKLDVNPYYFQ